MKFKIGDEVRSTSESSMFKGITGTIVGIYPSDEIRHVDSDIGEIWVSEHHYRVRIHPSTKPDHWPYPGDVYAPPESSIEKL